MGLGLFHGGLSLGDVLLPRTFLDQFVAFHPLKIALVGHSIGGISLIHLLLRNGPRIGSLELFVPIEVAFEMLAIGFGGMEFGLGGGNLLGTAAVFQLGIIGFGLVHGGLGGDDLVGPRAGHHFGQRGLGCLQLGTGKGRVGLQIGRFQLGQGHAFRHRVALVNIAFVNAAGDLEADGDFDGLDVAGDVNRVVAVAGEVQRVPPTAADRHDRGRHWEDQLLGSTHCSFESLVITSVRSSFRLPVKGL